MLVQLPPLPYEYSSLEPYISKKALIVHYEKHHQAYFDGFKKALEITPEPYKNMSPEEILFSLDKIPEPARTALKNFGGGYVNHAFFWSLMKKPQEVGVVVPSGELAQIIDQTFSSFQQFKKQFSQSAQKLFGSGWTWLVFDAKKKRLSIMNLPNQESPLTQGLSPLLVLDVWEHAYYLDYQNRRPEFIENWWRLVNWEKVAEHYSCAQQK